MRTLGSALRKGPEEAGGAFLPMPFRPLEVAGIRARMGTVTMIAGPPGAMKTGFTLYYVLRLGLPTLYLSADAEDFEMDERAAAALSGDRMTVVQQQPERYADALAENAQHIRLVFEDSPTYHDLELELSAYAEVYGQFPKILVLDNLMNLVGEQENEWAAMRDSTKVLHKITRITGAAVFVLHHMSDDRTDPSVPAPRKSLQGRVSQTAKGIWSLARSGNVLRIAAAKSKVSDEDPTGRDFVELWVTPENSRFYNSRYDMEAGRPA